MPPPNSYVLSTDESERIFNESILPTELGPILADHTPAHHSGGAQPLAVLLVGQTGAGKTRLAPALHAAMTAARRRRPAHFIADTYKAYHPAYATLIATDPAAASPATSADARRWLQMACARAAQLRVDALVESACRHPDDFCTLAAQFAQQGYSVRVAVLAVPAALSRLGVLVRFHRDLPEARSGKLPLRLTPRKVHDDSYAGLEGAAKWVDESDAVDRVVVVRRGDGVAFEGKRGMEEGRRWEDGGSAAEALATERRRPLTTEEMDGVKSDLEWLEGLGDADANRQIEEITSMVQAMEAESQAVDGNFPALVPFEAPEFVNGHLK